MNVKNINLVSRCKGARLTLKHLNTYLSLILLGFYAFGVSGVKWVFNTLTIYCKSLFLNKVQLVQVVYPYRGVLEGIHHTPPSYIPKDLPMIKFLNYYQKLK